jgi:hypothetical protein
MKFAPTVGLYSGWRTVALVIRRMSMRASITEVLQFAQSAGEYSN